MHYMSVPQHGSAAPATNRSRLWSLVPIAVFDIGGPLVAYSLLRSHGFSEVSALILSGVFPAFGVGLNVVRHRRMMPSASWSWPESLWARCSGWSAAMPGSCSWKVPFRP